MRFKTKCNIVAGSDAFSIVEVVIGIGMLGLAVVAALGLMRNYTSTIAEVKMRGENFDLRQYIRKSLDCNESLRTPTSINPDASIAAGCLAPGGASLEILTADGVTTLIRENPDGPETDLSFKTKTKLRAKCQGVGGDIGIFVEFVPWRRTGPSTGSVAPDPITGKPQVWTSISEEIPFLCSYDDSVSRTYTGCKFFDVKQKGTPGVQLKFPMPLVSDPRIAGGAPPIPATQVPHAGALLFVSGGPLVDLSTYTLGNKGSWSNENYLFTVTAFKDLTSAFSWKLDNIVGPRLIEAGYKVTIKNAKLATCEAVAESIPVTRGDIVGDPHGCFDPNTLVLLENGQTLKASLISKGDRVYNPILKKSFAVIETMMGPEHQLGMVEVGTKQGLVVVTSKHPFLTKDGLKAASDLTSKDLILNGKDAYSAITHLKTRQPSDNQNVYNFVLDAENSNLKHLVVGGGLISGDLFLQRKLVGERQATASK